MTITIHKVTCFITRQGEKGPELLLFNHPDVGVQIPAGTVNPGEDAESAALREAAEESGLEGLVLVRCLGEENDPPLEGFHLVARNTPAYAHPKASSEDWAHLRAGLPVQILRHEPGFTQVCYTELDNYDDPQYIRYNITGWVPDEALTDQRIHHFYLFNAPHPTPERWKVEVDYTTFELFWAPVNNLPAIVAPQDSWLKWLRALI